MSVKEALTNGITRIIRYETEGLEAWPNEDQEYTDYYKASEV